jgi:hypothetical protein
MAAPVTRRIVDPSGLTVSQLGGHACVICRKRFPSRLLGAFPSGEPALICDDHDLIEILEASDE